MAQPNTRSTSVARAEPAPVVMRAGEAHSIPAVWSPDNAKTMLAYLDTVTTPEAIAVQQRLAAAYDTACASLIGPNDIQKERDRDFKKKSAWKKLARYFQLSTEVVPNANGEPFTLTQTARDWLVTVRVRATFPWGWGAEDLGACGSDEMSGRRVITLADAVATATTRATNRAISNLVAMGEVSAEEVQRGEMTPDERHAQKEQERADAAENFSIQGKPVKDMTDKQLGHILASCKATPENETKYAKLIERIETALEARRLKRLTEGGDETAPADETKAATPETTPAASAPADAKAATPEKPTNGEKRRGRKADETKAATPEPDAAALDRAAQEAAADARRAELDEAAALDDADDMDDDSEIPF